MTIAGWFVMGISIVSVTALFGWCLYKVLTIPGEVEHLRGIDQHTPDQDED